MTRAIVKKDIIIKLVCDNNTGIEIGKLPKNIGLSRLRWDGEKVVDLFDLNKFYVDQENKILHVVDTGNCDLVKMSYNERRLLTKDLSTGKLRVKTQEEIEQPKKDEYKARRRKEYPSLGDQMGAIIKYLKTKNDLPEELKGFIKDVDDVKDKWKKPGDKK